jgi:hypothetical protein
MTRGQWGEIERSQEMVVDAYNNCKAKTKDEIAEALRAITRLSKRALLEVEVSMGFRARAYLTRGAIAKNIRARIADRHGSWLQIRGW